MGLSDALEGIQQHPWPPPTRSQYQEIADILKISKSIKLLVKIKKMFLLSYGKKLNGLFGQLNNFTSQQEILKGLGPITSDRSLDLVLSQRPPHCSQPYSF